MPSWLLHLLEVPQGKRDNKASLEHLEKPQALSSKKRRHSLCGSFAVVRVETIV